MEHLFILSIIFLALFLFIKEWFSPDLVAIAVMVILMVSGVLTPAEGFSGFSNPAVITVLAMFILSAGLIKTGVGDYLGHMMVRYSGSNPIIITLMVMIVVGLMSAFMNNIAATVILMGSMYSVAKATNYPVSKLLIPLSFGSLLGGVITLIGTPPNLLVSNALEEYGYDAFRLFDFLPTGLVILIIGMLYMAFIGRHLIPIRQNIPDVLQDYSLNDYMTQVVIGKNSSLANQAVDQTRLSNDYGLTIVSMERRFDTHTLTLIPHGETILQPGDRLILEGNIEKVLDLSRQKMFSIIGKHKKMGDFEKQNIELAEVTLAPNSVHLGQNIRQANLFRRYGILVIGVKRRESPIRRNLPDVIMKFGDILLVEGTSVNIQRLFNEKSFLLVNRVNPVVREYKKAPFAIGSLALTIFLAAMGLMHISVAGFVGVLAMVLSGCIKVEEIYKEVEWKVLFLIAGLLPLGLAMDQQHTGTAAWIAEGLFSLFGYASPHIILGALVLITMLLTQVVSNAAAAVLMAPLGISAAQAMEIMPYAFLMGIAIAASTTFITPIGHQANVLVYGVGGYKFTDFMRVGWVLSILIFVAIMVVVPMFWPFF